MKEKTSGDDLVALILSMGQSEKRYFRLFLNRSLEKVDKDVDKLYEYLQQAGHWSEAAIRAEFVGKGFLKQLNVIRTRLQQLILDALSRHDHGKTFQLDFARRMNEIDVLFRRKLFHPCMRATKSTVRRAKQIELPVFELQALNWMLRLERQFPGADLPNRLSVLLDRQQQLAIQITDEIELVKLHDTMLSLAPQYAIVGDNHLPKADSALSTLHLRFPSPNDLPFDSKILYLHIQSYHALFHTDRTAYFHCLRGLVETWESLPERMVLEEDRYLKTLFSYAEAAGQAGENTAFLSVLAKLKRLLQHQTNLRASEKMKLLNLELKFLAESHQWAEATAFVPEIERALKQFGDKIHPLLRINLISNTIVALFFDAQWSQILTWIDALVSETIKHPSDQWLLLTRTTRWVVAYELHHHETLERELRPFLKTNKTVSADALAQAFEVLLQSETISDEKQGFTSLLGAVEARRALGNMPHLNLLAIWATARVLGVSLAEAEAAHT